MSERENEIEEEGILDDWSHEEHPLTLMETHHMGARCYGCRRHFSSGEQAYGCSKKCGYTELLHEECAEMPRKITHSRHRDNEHVLILKPTDHSLLSWCEICDFIMWDTIGYKCTSLECKYEMHLRCARARGDGMMEAVDDDDDDRSSSRTIQHPSHPPNHQLRLFEKISSFKCDACGITGRGKSYICNTCPYWIHERCATLPQTVKREDHHHSLSISFHVPTEYLKYDYKCEVCNKVFLISRYWIYHCHLCRYVVHLKCAFKIKTTVKNKAMDEKDIIRLPTDDMAEELIRPVVMSRGGGGAIARVIPPPPPHDDDDDEMLNVKKYKFVRHEHELTLISSFISSHHQKERGEDDSDEYEEDWGKRSELICDGCITPILSSSDKYYYMRCSECKYNLHLACFNLPPLLPSLPLLHNEAEHELLLISCPKDKPWYFWDFHCSVCRLRTNGLMYKCRKCSFKADIKCASLPHTIHHAAHPQRLLNLLTPNAMQSNNLYSRMCDACPSYLGQGQRHFCYAAEGGIYEFAVHVLCAMLPPSVKGRRWDRHHPRLPLTYDANINHPGEFYCDECETKMNPKSWMYHCRHCDLSFHPECFQLTSGRYKNMKLGQKYYIPKAHPHPLTYQILTTKRRCNACGGICYQFFGFQCASFICFYCGGGRMD